MVPSAAWTTLWVVVLVTEMGTPGGDVCVGDGESDVSDVDHGDQQCSLNSKIYCEGALLDMVQMSGMYNDSKTFVDMPMKRDPEDILKRFGDLPARPDINTLREFVQANFQPAGSDTEFVTPDDWKESPKFLSTIQNKEIRQWASGLNRLWKELFRRTVPDINNHPQRYSLLSLPHSFVVPGGRFREMFYWDSYWGLKGLLLCDMGSSVKGMLRNFVALINRFGYVPNFARVYASERSQPPLLASMVEDYINVTGDNSFLDEVLPALEKEYKFWQEKRSVIVIKNGAAHTLQRYHNTLLKPRPESYKEDIKAFSGANKSVYAEVRAACESGWDFSSRWFGRSGPQALTLSSLRTSQVIPVDLNSIMYMMESSLARLYAIADNPERQRYFLGQAAVRAKAIEAVFWDGDKGAWFDYDLELNTPRPYYYSSSGFPVFAGCHGSTEQSRAQREARFVKYLQTVGVLGYPGGIPTSLDTTNQQWDFPNAWPPLVHITIMGLSRSHDETIQKLAVEQAQKWLRTNYLGWKKHGYMFEKYDVTQPSGPGGGGEYDVQVGFAWTNGIVLDFIHHFGNAIDCDEFHETANTLGKAKSDSHTKTLSTEF